jgi:hypothetical protein
MYNLKKKGKEMKNFLKNFSLMGFLMFIMCVVLGIGDVSGAVMMAEGTAATVDTGSNGAALDKGTQVSTPERDVLASYDYRKWSPDLIKDDVDQNVVQIRPYANQLDTILRYVGTKNVNTFEFEYYAISSRDVNDKVVTFTATKNGTKHGCTATLKVNNPANFDVTDTINVLKAGEDEKPLMLYVYQKSESGDTLYVTCSEDQVETVDGGYQIPAIAAETEIFAMARAAAETDVLSPAVEFLPEKARGYCQRFMFQISESNYAKMADKELKWDLSEIEEEALFDYRRRMEASFLFGHMAKIYDPSKKRYIYTTGGIVNQISNTYTLNSAAQDGNKEIVDMTKHIFMGNSGAKERFAFAGSDAVAKISKMNGVVKQQDAVKTEVIMGITWSKMVSNFGTINLAHHEILDEYGFKDKLIVIDPQFLRKYQIENLSKQNYNGRELAIVNGDIVVFNESAGVAVLNPNAHCIVTVA